MWLNPGSDWAWCSIHLVFVGSYYYHNTEPGMNYEDTILGVYKYVNQSGIPYRYVGTMKIQYLGVQVLQPVWHSLQVCWNYEDTILGVYKYVNQSGIPYRYVGTIKIQYLGCTSMPTSLAFPTGMLELWRYNTWGVQVCQPVWHSLQVCWNYEDTILGVYKYVDQSGIPYRYVGTMKIQYLGCTSMSTSLAFPTGMLELWRYNTCGVQVCQPVWHSLQVCWNYEDPILGVYKYVNQSGIPYRYVGTMKIQYLGCTSMPTSLAFPTGMLELWRYNTWGVQVCQPVWHSLQVCWNYEDTILGVYKYANQSGIPYRYVGTMKIQYLGCTSMPTSLAFPTGMLELWRYNTWLIVYSGIHTIMRPTGATRGRIKCGSTIVITINKSSNKTNY